MDKGLTQLSTDLASAKDKNEFNKIFEEIGQCMALANDCAGVAPEFPDGIPVDLISCCTNDCLKIWWKKCDEEGNILPDEDTDLVSEYALVFNVAWNFNPSTQTQYFPCIGTIEYQTDRQDSVEFDICANPSDPAYQEMMECFLSKLDSDKLGGMVIRDERNMQYSGAGSLNIVSKRSGENELSGFRVRFAVRGCWDIDFPTVAP